MNYALTSVVLCLYSFLGGPLSWACSFIWMIPLFVWKNASGSDHKKSLDVSFCSVLKRVRHILGFNFCTWGLLVFGIHFSWIACLMITRAVYVWQGVFVWLIAVAWFTSWSCLWLWCITYPQASVLKQFVSTLLFFWFLAWWSLWPCGVFEGYPLINPLLPLAQYPELLWFLRWLGDVGGFVCLIGFQIAVARLIVYRWSFLYLLLALLCLMPFCVGPLLYQKNAVQTDGFLFLEPWWYGTKNPMYAGYRMLYDLGKAAQQHVNNISIKAIILPESAFCFDVQEYAHFVPLWCEAVENTPIVFGGHYVQGAVCKNRIFVLCNGYIQQTYDKVHDMPFVERAPTLFAKVGLMPFVLHGVHHAIPTEQCDIVELCGKKYQIFICSEFFFEAKPVKGDTVLLLWNDSWLCFNWTKRLAMLFVLYFSVKYDVAVVHGSTGGITNIRKHEFDINENYPGDLSVR